MSYTKSVEDYLEAMYVLENTNGVIRVKEIADFLSVKLPSVTEIITKLQIEGLVEHAPYGDIKLTEKGAAVGTKVWERHKALYTFLKDYLKVDDKNAFKEACLIEHVVSEDTIKKLNEFLEKIERF